MLTINTEYKEGIFYVRLKGHLNKKTVNKLYKKVSLIIQNVGITNLVFNLENLKSIDIKGINSLFYNYELTKSNNGYSLIVSNNKINDLLKKKRIYNYMTEITNEMMASDIIRVR